MNKFFSSMIRLALALVLAPIVYSCAITFYRNLSYYPSDYKYFIISGVTIFLILFLFIYPFTWLFQAGQGIAGRIFGLIPAASHFLTRLLSIYLTVTFIAFHIFKNVLKTDHFDGYFLFAAGFFFTMHILSIAQDVQEEGSSSIKLSTVWLVSFIFIFNLYFSVFFLDKTAHRTNLGAFHRSVVALSKRTYHHSWREVSSWFNLPRGIDTRTK